MHRSSDGDARQTEPGCEVVRPIVDAAGGAASVEAVDVCSTTAATRLFPTTASLSAANDICAAATAASISISAVQPMAATSAGFRACTAGVNKLYGASDVFAACGVPTASISGGVPATTIAHQCSAVRVPAILRSYPRSAIYSPRHVLAPVCDRRRFNADPKYRTAAAKLDACRTATRV